MELQYKVVQMALLNLAAFSSNPTYSGEAAKSSLFGANFLFNRDGSFLTEIDENYKKFLSEAQVSTLRYPGGTLTETHLDLADPESTSANFMNPGSTGGSTVPLSTFLELCKSSGASATVVLPTYRFLNDFPDASGHRQVNTAEEENLRNFVRATIEKAQALGVTVSAFEVGNEWYVDNSAVFGFRMSPVEYGRVANYLTAIVQEEIEKLSQLTDVSSPLDPAIVIQVGPGSEKEIYTPSGFRPQDGYAGPTITATQLIAEQFTDPDARSAVDGVLMHRYLTVSDERAGEWVYNPFKTWTSVTAGIPGFNAVDQYVTEWNVSARNENERGLAQFDSMFEMLREMLLAGVDHANVWAVQQNNFTRMIYNSGADGFAYGGLTFGGLAFDIASAQLRGLKTLRAPEAISGISINAFGSENRSVIVLSNRSDEELIHTVDLSKIIKAGHHATLYRIQEGVDGKPTVEVLTINIKTASLLYDLQFGAQESIVLVVAARQSGSTIEGYDQNDRLYGSAFADKILAGDGDDSCDGGSGGDFIQGEVGQDTLVGGEGNDTLHGGANSDLVNGGNGRDLVYWSSGGDTLNGGAGEDTLSFRGKSTAIFLDLGSQQSLDAVMDGAIISEVEGYAGTSYNDVMVGATLADLLLGGEGDDFIIGGDGSDRLFGEVGADTILGDQGNDSIFGGSGDDSIDGGLGSESIDGGDGSDSLCGGSGNDTLAGASGYDFLLGGPGDDRLIGGEDTDSIMGDDGMDFIFGGAGGDCLRGGAANDTLDAGEGNDALHGDDGTDRMLGGNGNDTAFGGEGSDTIFGGSGRDYLSGGGGNDLVYGGAEQDFLFGGDGNDTLRGENGDDFLHGSSGSDVLFGGAGRDTFVFSDTIGSSRIVDFTDNVDTLQFQRDLFAEGMTVRDFVDTYATRVGNVIVFDFEDGGILTVGGVAGIGLLYDDINFV